MCLIFFVGFFKKNIGSHWGGGDMFLKKVLDIWSACKILIKSGGPHEVPSLAGCGIRQQGLIGEQDISQIS